MDRPATLLSFPWQLQVAPIITDSQELQSYGAPEGNFHSSTVLHYFWEFLQVSDSLTCSFIIIASCLEPWLLMPDTCVVISPKIKVETAGKYASLSIIAVSSYRNSLNDD